MDCCVWPSNASYVANCLETLSSVLSMSANFGGHVQIPVMQSQTKVTAWVKHKRVLEDTLHQHAIDITSLVSLHFDKTGSHANDKRPVHHPCLFVKATSHQQPNHFEASAAAISGHIGPCALIKVTDMIGYENDGNRYGPAARTEQCLSSQSCFSQHLDAEDVENFNFHVHSV